MYIFTIYLNIILVYSKQIIVGEEVDDIQIYIYTNYDIMNLHFFVQR